MKDRPIVLANDDLERNHLARDGPSRPRRDWRRRPQQLPGFDQVCVCGVGAQMAAGELVPVEAAVVAMAACDNQHIGELLPRSGSLRAANENAGLDASLPASAEGRPRASAVEPTGSEVTAPQQSSNHAHVGTPRRRERSAANTRAAPTTPPRSTTGAAVRPAPRAHQSIPPALRRAVLTRDRRRCRVPGCTHATFVDVHHVQPHAEGGRNEASDLLTMCSAHHRAVHRGELLSEHEREGSIMFRHTDGAAYVKPKAPRIIDAHAKVFSALRQLGFREGAIKVVLSELRDDAELGGATPLMWKTHPSPSSKSTATTRRTTRWRIFAVVCHQK